MKSKFLLIALLFLSFCAYSQNFVHHQVYDWQSEPVLHALSDQEKKLSAVVLKEYHALEYQYDENDVLNLYKTVHKIVRVNDDVAVETFNKVFVAMSHVTQFTVLKARAITPNNKIVTLNKDNIKEVENLGDIGPFKIFAIEGVEKGGEVEYLYTTQSPVSEPYGGEVLQSDVFAREVSFTLFSPDNLLFEANAYNGFPQPTLHEMADGRLLSASLQNVPPLLEEPYANYRANLMRVNYKVSYNKTKEGTASARLYDWNMAAASFYELLTEADEDGKKMANKTLKLLKLNKLKGKEEQIKAIENYLKTNITLTEGSGDEFRQVGRTLANKYANELGISRLFAVLLKEAKINFEIVITCDRTNFLFDKDFEAWNAFTDILIYFPETQQYISPTQAHFRYGPAPYNYTNNYGLFIADLMSSHIESIQAPTAQQNMNRTETFVRFGTEFAPMLDMKQSWNGYRGAEFRAVYAFQKEEFAKNRLQADIHDAEVKELVVSNEKLEQSAYPDKAFTLTGKVAAPSLIEKAGNAYLFKVGEIIGSQVEMYQDHERQQPIDMSYPIYYQRIISFEIPQGYTLKGLEDVKMDKFMGEKDNKFNRFVADYKIEGKKVTITADEYYQKTILPKEQITGFRSVINAAADFNKMVLVFEKE